MTTPTLALFHRVAAKTQPVEKNCPRSLVDAAKDGFWWCKDCRKVTDVNVDKEMTRCVTCGFPRVRWNPPVLT